MREFQPDRGTPATHLRDAYRKWSREHDDIVAARRARDAANAARPRANSSDLDFLGQLNAVMGVNYTNSEMPTVVATSPVATIPGNARPVSSVAFQDMSEGLTPMEVPNRPMYLPPRNQVSVGTQPTQATPAPIDHPDYSGMSFGGAFNKAIENGGENSIFYWTNKAGVLSPFRAYYGKKKPTTSVAATPSLDPVMSDEEAAASVNDFNDPVAAQPIPTAGMANRFERAPSGNFGSAGYNTSTLTPGYGGGPDPQSSAYELSLLKRFRQAADATARARAEREGRSNVAGEP